VASYANSNNQSQIGATHIPEIQGLRGVAVLVVVLFHAGVLLPGGYIGVDIFFVISGFVITKLLFREFESGRTKVIRRFFLGRFYRLFPASGAVVLFTLFLSTIALSPIDGIQSVTSISRNASLFFANIGLIDSGGYFFSVNPLEHLWSLGVEAQFYLIYPFVFLCLHRFSKRWKQTSLVFVFMISCLIVASLFFATFGAKVIAKFFDINARDFSFYMMPSRSWEFLFGTLVALTPNNKEVKKSVFKLCVLLVGIAIIIGSAVLFGKQDGFPSLLSLLPAFGSAIVILLYKQSFVVVALLRSRLLIFIGNISYSWYLWHWPFIVFSKVLFPDINNVSLVFAFASLGPAWLSYRFIENRYKLNNKNRVSQFAAIAICSIVLPIMTSYAIDGFRTNLKKYVADVPALEDLRFSVVNQCQHVVQIESDKCFMKSDNSMNRVVLFGDSHASSASDGVVSAAEIARFELGIVSFDGCPPFPISEAGDGCSDARVIYEQTLEGLTPDAVVLVNSLEHYLQYDGNKIETAFIVKSLTKYVEYLTSSKVRVVIVLQVPSMEMSGQVSVLRPRLSTSTSDLAAQTTRLSLINQLRNGLGANQLVSFVETDDLFCKSNICDPRSGGNLIYRDQSHLNPLGSLRLAVPLATALQFGE
jgi:peptidoglycan/LPS O-acetylase OafA/YrhL